LVNANYRGNGSGIGPYPLLYGPQNGLIYVGDLITRNVSVVNPLTNKVEFNISGVGSPIGLALDPSNNYISPAPIPSL
jgi:YVTN family beta-propeller protein